MSESQVPLRVPKFTSLSLTILCLALFQLGLVAGELGSVLDAGKPMTGLVLRGAVWALLGASALRMLPPGLRRPVYVQPEA